MTDKETVIYKIKDIPLPLKHYPYGIIHSLTIYEDHIEVVKSDPNTEFASTLSQYKQQLVEQIENLDEMIEAFDASGHRYQIPKSKSGEWIKWRGIPEDDERSWDVPDFAERIDGMPLQSIKDRVISIIKGEESKNIGWMGTSGTEMSDHDY